MATPPESTPPPAAAPGQQQYGYRPGTGNAFASLPMPGNAELVVYLLVEIMFAVIWAASGAVDAGGFVTATAAVTFAYLISRGIAKASRVLEQ